MKMTELTTEELVEINGGAVTNNPYVSLGLTIGGGNLLTLSLRNRDEDGKIHSAPILNLRGLNNILKLGNTLA